MVTLDCASVAVIDDDSAVRDSLKFLLEAAGYSVAEYASCEAFLNGGAARLACMILDQHMPHMTGLELAGRLRAVGTLVPILLTTASPSPSIAAGAAKLGIEKLCEKPLAEDDLLDFVAGYARPRFAGG